MVNLENEDGDVVWSVSVHLLIRKNPGTQKERPVHRTLVTDDSTRNVFPRECYQGEPAAAHLALILLLAAGIPGGASLGRTDVC